MLNQVGLAIAVQDANEQILPYVDWQTRLPGGHGAVREVCDYILHVQGKMPELLESYTVT